MTHAVVSGFLMRFIPVNESPDSFANPNNISQ